MMINAGTICEPELEQIRRAVAIFNITEVDGFGVTLASVAGIRSWIVTSPKIEVMVTGSAADFLGTFVIPLRLIKQAEIQCNLGEEVELTITGDMARFTGETGFSEMQLLDQDEEFSEFDISNVTTAEIRSSHLGQLIFFGTEEPTGIRDRSVIEKVPPVSQIIFGAGSLEIITSYREINAKTIRINQDAVIRGKTGQFVVNRVMLRSVFDLLHGNENEMVTISADIESGTRMQIEGTNWKILINREQFGAARFHSQIVDILDSANIEHLIGTDGRICAKIDDTNIEIQLLDGRLPITRCTIELVTGVERSFDLLQEIEQQNEGRVCTKFFIRGNAIVACLDFVCGQSLDLIDELRALVADSDLLGECLASLGVIGDKLDLIFES